MRRRRKAFIVQVRLSQHEHRPRPRPSAPPPLTHAHTRTLPPQSYHVLKAHGVPPSQIITLSYDDAASSPLNPRPGTLINSPGGADVRAGVPLDYSGAEVSSETFLAVLLGDSEKVAKIAPNGTGRVLRSTSEERVFVFYSDHGAPGCEIKPLFDFFRLSRR